MTLKGLADVPPTNSRVANMNRSASDPVNLILVNLTVMSTLAHSALTNMEFSDVAYKLYQ